MYKIPIDGGTKLYLYDLVYIYTFIYCKRDLLHQQYSLVFVFLFQVVFLGQKYHYFLCKMRGTMTVVIILPHKWPPTWQVPKELYQIFNFRKACLYNPHHPCTVYFVMHLVLNKSNLGKVCNYTVPFMDGMGYRVLLLGRLPSGTRR